MAEEGAGAGPEAPALCESTGGEESLTPVSLGALPGQSLPLQPPLRPRSSAWLAPPQHTHFSQTAGWQSRALGRHLQGVLNDHLMASAAQKHREPFFNLPLCINTVIYWPTVARARFEHSSKTL